MRGNEVRNLDPFLQEDWYAWCLVPRIISLTPYSSRTCCHLVFLLAVRFVCSGMIKRLILNITYLVLGALLAREIDHDYSLLRVVQLLRYSGCCTVTCRCVCTYFWTCHEWSCRRMISSSGGTGRSRWGNTRVNRFAGAYPPNTQSTRGIPRIPRSPRSR